MIEEVAEYRTIEPEMLRAGAERTLRAFLTLAGDPTGPVAGTATELGREAAIRRAAQLPLDVLLRAWRLFERLGWQLIADEARRHAGGAEAVLDLTPLWLQLFDQSTSAATDQYVAERQRTLAEDARARRDLIEDLLAGRISTQQAENRIAAWGLPTATRYVLLVSTIRSGEVNGDLAQASESLSASFAAAGLVGFTVVRHDELICLLPRSDGREQTQLDLIASAVDKLDHRHGIRVCIGVSTPFSTIADTRRAYGEAHSALRLVPDQGRSVVSLSQVSLSDYLVAHADPVAARIVPPGVSRLLDEDTANDHVLLETLQAYVDADLHVDAAASALHVHPNTVYYRLAKISDLTSCNPRSFWGLVDLLIGSRILRAYATTDSGDGTDRRG